MLNVNVINKVLKVFVSVLQFSKCRNAPESRVRVIFSSLEALEDTRHLSDN